jgi:hypothetical protein
MPAEISHVGRESTFTERADANVTLRVYARLAMLIAGITLPIGTGIVGWSVNRLVDKLDEQAHKQENLARDFAQLQIQVLNVVSAQLQNSKNIADRIEFGEKNLNDRINILNAGLQNLANKHDALARIVYQNVNIKTK